jgi:hypothetical protein
MNDDRSTAGPDDPTLDPADPALASDDAALGDAPVGADAPTDGGKMDEYDDAVMAADDTGMLAGQRLITTAELDQGS